MVLVDTNSLLVFVLGLIDPRLINNHKRTSVFTEEDFQIIMTAIGGSLENLIVTPNTLTEVDNLISDTFKTYQHRYTEIMGKIFLSSSEKYLPSKELIGDYHFPKIGVTDSIILRLRPFYKILITGDSDLGDFARSLDISVIDLKEIRNKALRN